LAVERFEAALIVGGRALAVERRVGCREESWLSRGELAVERKVGCREESWLSRGKLAVERKVGCREV
jgi:hypothetical protein